MTEPYFQKDDITIYCGNALEIMPNLESVGLVLTDPPYMTNKFQWDKVTIDFIDEASKQSISLLKEGFVLFFGSMSKLEKLLSLNPDRLIFQCRDFIHFRPVPIQWAVDPILVWIKTTNLNYARRDWFFMSMADMSKRGPSEHPTPKRVSTMLKLIKDYSINKGTILDPFLGSGTTLVAAKELNRKAIGIEIEEKYCEIAAKRVEKAIKRDRMSFHFDRKEERKGFEL